MKNLHVMAALVIDLRALYCEWSDKTRSLQRAPNDAEWARYEKEIESICQPVWGCLVSETKKQKRREVHIGHNIANWPAWEAEIFVDVANMLNTPQKIAFLRDLEGLRREDSLQATTAWKIIFAKEPRIPPAFTLSKEGKRLDCWHRVPSNVEEEPNGFWWVSADREIVSRFVDAIVPKNYRIYTTPEGTKYWLPQ